MRATEYRQDQRALLPCVADPSVARGQWAHCGVPKALPQEINGAEERRDSARNSPRRIPLLCRSRPDGRISGDAGISSDPDTPPIPGTLVDRRTFIGHGAQAALAFGILPHAELLERARAARRAAVRLRPAARPLLRPRAEPEPRHRHLPGRRRVRRVPARRQRPAARLPPGGAAGGARVLLGDQVGAGGAWTRRACRRRRPSTTR